GTDAERKERDEYLRELKGRYELTYFSFQEIFPWFRLPDGTSAATVAEEETLAVCTAAGKELLSGAWRFLGASADEDLLFPVREQDQWFFVDDNGERRLVPDGTYLSLHSFSEGLAPATRKRGPEPDAPVVAGYLDQILKEVRFDFQETYPLEGGYALARKDGTYFVLDTSLQEVTACEFTAVKADPYGNAQKYGMILGRLPGDPEQWAMYAPNGIRVNEFSADDIRLPEEVKAPLAFCKDGLWGFVTLDGTVLLEPRFEDALSFSKGMAAVKKDGKWGYIDETGDFLIPPTFDEAGPLSPTGSAFVKNHAGYSLMTLSRYTRSEK
ncbi:MAG: WG repeat-containing protein, partial [Clostridia bacterium]|nr:WG repeat-containing protein [Clostridia bacterium]